MIFVTHLKCLADMAERQKPGRDAGAGLMPGQEAGRGAKPEPGQEAGRGAKPGPGREPGQGARLVLAEGEHAVNYVTERAEQDPGTENAEGIRQAAGSDADAAKVRKTYRIVRGQPSAGIFEQELFDKYFGTVLR